MKRMAFLIGLLLMSSAAGHAADSSDVIKIGMVNDQTGANKGSGRGMKVGVDAYFKAVNEKGGVNGKKLQLVAVDSRPLHPPIERPRRRHRGLFLFLKAATHLRPLHPSQTRIALLYSSRHRQKRHQPHQTPCITVNIRSGAAGNCICPLYTGGASGVGRATFPVIFHQKISYLQNIIGHLNSRHGKCYYSA